MNLARLFSFTSTPRRSPHALARRGLRALVISFLVPACSEAPALSIADVSFTRSDLLGLSETQSELLSMIAALGVATSPRRSGSNRWAPHRSRTGRPSSGTPAPRSDTRTRRRDRSRFSRTLHSEPRLRVDRSAPRDSLGALEVDWRTRNGSQKSGSRSGPSAGRRAVCGVGRRRFRGARRVGQRRTPRAGKRGQLGIGILGGGEPPPGWRD